MTKATDPNFGWKFQTRSFSDAERRELWQDNLAWYVETFIRDVCDREQEIREDDEIPTDADRVRIIGIHRKDARDQMLATICREFDKRGVGALDDDGPFTYGFDNWSDPVVR